MKIASHFKSHFKPQLQSLVTQALTTATSLLPSFNTYFLASTSELPFTPSEGDTDISATISDLGCSVLSFISEVSHSNKLSSIYLDASSTPAPAFENLIQALLSLTRITTTQYESWLEDPNTFINDTEESTDVFGFDLRISSIDLLSEFLDAYPSQTLSSLSSSVSTLVSQSRQAKEGGDPNWWKIEEAILASLGGNSESIIQILEAQSSTSGLSLDLNGIFQHLVMPNLASQTKPLLKGRAFIFASQFAESMPEQLAKGMLEEAVKTMEGGNQEGVEEEEKVLVRLGGMRAVKK